MDGDRQDREVVFVTFMDGDYQIRVFADIPGDDRIDGFTASRMWLMELASLYRAAAHEDERDGWFWSAKLHRQTADNIDKVIEETR